MEQLEGYYSSGTTGVTVQETLAILWRRKWIALTVFLITLGIAYRIVHLRKAAWTATAQMMVTLTGTQPDTNGANGNVVQMETPETQQALIEGEGMAEKTREGLTNIANNMHIPPASIGVTEPSLFRLDYTAAVKVVNPPDTNLLEVAVTLDNPNRAALWANTVCAAFVEFKKGLANRTLTSQQNELRTQASQAKAKLNAAEQKETEFKRHHGFVDFPAEQKTIEEQFVARETELQAAQQALQMDRVNLDRVNAQIASMTGVMKQNKTVSNPALIQDLEKQIQDLNAEIATLGRKWRRETAPPGIFEPLEAQRKNLQDALDKAMKAESSGSNTSLATLQLLRDQKIVSDRAVATDQNRIAGLTGLFNDLKAKRDRLPGQNAEYRKVAGDLALAQQSYINIQAQLNKVETEQPTATGNVIITQAAFTPMFPSNLPAGRIWLVCILFGIMFAIGSALFVDRGDTRVRSVERVRALVSGPIVGTLPKLNPMQMRRLIAGETPPIAAEAYSLACANLMLALRHAWQDELWHRQLVLITSAVPNEGKSITAAEVARFMARSGKSVILVDADMRRPTQRRLFNVDGEFGLADALTGEKKIADLLVESDEPNLRLLPSGYVHKNPTALMSSPRMVEALDELRELADLVIVDAPACAVVADAMLVAPHVDCIIQVVGAGVVSEKLVRETTEALRAAAPRTFAFMVNRAPNDRSRVYTPYYFKEYRSAANGNGHTAGHITYALPTSAPAADTPAAPSHAANGNGHADHDQIAYALPEAVEHTDGAPTAESPNVG